MTKSHTTIQLVTGQDSGCTRTRGSVVDSEVKMTKREHVDVMTVTSQPEHSHGGHNNINLITLALDKIVC